MRIEFNNKQNQKIVLITFLKTTSKMKTIKKDDIIEISIKTMLTIFTLVIMWIAITTTIQRFKTPELSETELFLRIPKSFELNWYD